MSTSLLYHAFGLVGYRYVKQSFQEGEVAFRIEQPRERHRCSACARRLTCACRRGRMS
jgi:transposase